MKKAGMILEGGGQRGIFTSGVLDYLMEKKFMVPYVIGVSAGACNAVDYVSGQILRTKECMLDAQLDHELYGVRTMLKTKYFMNMDLEQNCRELCRLDEMNKYLEELMYPSEHVNFI